MAVRWGYFDELTSWTWDVETGHPMTVHVYPPGDHAQLLLNGKEFAPTAFERAMATFTVPYEPGELTAVAFRDGREIGRSSLTTVGAPAALRLAPDVRALTTSRDDLAHVHVKVTDHRGRLVPDATVPVTFAVTGAGELAGVASGNPHNVDKLPAAAPGNLARARPGDPPSREETWAPDPHSHRAGSAPGHAHPAGDGGVIRARCRCPRRR